MDDDVNCGALWLNDEYCREHRCSKGKPHPGNHRCGSCPTAWTQGYPSVRVDEITGAEFVERAQRILGLKFDPWQRAVLEQQWNYYQTEQRKTP